VEDRALENVELVEAFVATETIPQGMSGSAAVANGLVDRTEVMRRTLPDGAVTQLDQISGQVAGADILPGELLLTGRFVDPVAAAQDELEIPEGMVAISVQVGIPPGVAGFIENDDHVSIIAHVAVPPDDPEVDQNAPAEEQEAQIDAQSEERTQFLLQDVVVLNVGQRVVVTTEQGEDEQIQREQGAMLMTLALTHSQAEQLAFAQFEGELYFTLLPEAEEGAEPNIVDTEGRTFENLFE
ncbi:MAG: Flp pilus assembly protein CpaB, partial [Halobacteriales archaeon]|nr:Flp pilus assembly protein CpaB [Halobacteriales archaeon]